MMLARKQNTKRVLASFLALVMLLGLLPVSVFASEGDVQDTQMVEITLPADETEAPAEGEAVVDEAPVDETEAPVEDEAPVDETEAPAEDEIIVDEEPMNETEPPAMTEEPAEEPVVIEETETPMAVAPVEDALSETAIQATADDGAVITVSGLLPQGAYVTAEPVEVTLEDLTVLAAYDITIYDAEGNVWQPDESVVVNIETPALADAGEVEIYHMEDENAEPERVESVTAESDVAIFSAESFSIYVVTSPHSFFWDEIDGKEYAGAQKISLFGSEGSYTGNHHWKIVKGGEAASVTGNSRWATLTIHNVQKDTTVTVRHSYGYLFRDCEEATFTVKAGQPTAQTQTVYVYVDATNATGGNANSHGYFTIGTIELPITETPSAAYNSSNGANLYSQYKEDIAVDSIYHEYNSWLDLDTVDWYLLHADKGADDYVDSNTWAWHLDGKITEVPNLYSVTYHANNGTDTKYVDSSWYEKDDTVRVLGNDSTKFTNGEKEFKGWSTTANGDIVYTPDNTFKMGTKDVDLYAVWGDPITTGTLTVKKSVEGEAALPDGFKILVKDNSGNTAYTLGLTADSANNVIGPDAGTEYTWTIPNVAPGAYTIDEENALVGGYDLTSNANPTTVFVKAGSTSFVNVTNTYTNASDETASFTIKKVESGTTNGLEGAVFHICTDVNCDGDCDNGQTVTTADGGLAEISGLKSGTTYYLRETKAPQGYELGNTVYKITVAGEHEKQSTGGNIFSYLWKLVASVFAGESDTAMKPDSDGNFRIPNEKIPTGMLEITKTFSGVNDLPGSFKIKVTAEDGTEKLYSLSDAAIKTPDAGYYEWDLSLPVGSYRVEETGYEMTDYNVSIQIDEKTNVTNPRTNVVVMEDYETSLSFVNTYTATTPTPVSPVEISFSGLKYLDNSATNVPQFTFVLNSFEKDIATPLTAASTQVAEVQNDSHGLIFFPTQSFASEGTYWYKIAERIASPDGYRYDTTVYYIEVVVTETANGLAAVPTYYKSVDDQLVETTDGLNFYNYSVPADEDALTITKTGAGSVTVGSNITYTIMVTNPSEYAAENVTVTDTLDTKLTYVESDNSGVYDSTTRTVTWNVGTLAAGESKALTVTATANQTGTIENIAYVDYTGNGDPIPSTAVTTNVTSEGTTPSNPPYTGDDDGDDDVVVVINPGRTPTGSDPEPSEEPTEIPEPSTPMTDLPEDSGEDIPEETTPLAPSPDVDDGSDDTEIVEGTTPMGDLPQTGAVAAPVNPAVTASLVALAFSMAGCGLYFTFGRKKGEEED